MIITFPIKIMVGLVLLSIAIPFAFLFESITYPYKTQVESIIVALVIFGLLELINCKGLLDKEYNDVINTLFILIGIVSIIISLYFFI
ncbi:hypothetical protein [Sutcliffiella halmapala]|uniref:hypothetical protein n=1 Tax=Sutcliffiella halmapala TaxID=79882 RepID=UPI0009952B51|nr:hypothetical protein [Sutcliffiella halmapala]